MIEHDFPQGSPAWHRWRTTALNASEAAAAMGCSPYITRDQLLYALFTGTRPEVSPEQQRLFDKGHATEAKARPVAEAWLGKVLFPLVGSLPPGTFDLKRPLAASFDGLNAMQSENFECKLLNAEIRAALPNAGWEGRELNAASALPLFYRVQMEQQLMVCDTVKRVLFMAAEFEGDKLVDCRLCWYTSDPQLRAQIIAAWHQVEADLAVYVVPEVKPAPPVPNKVAGTLPALIMDVRGEVLASNLQEWELAANEKVDSIIDPETLTTDQDFEDAKEAVKWIEDATTELRMAKKLALAKMQTVEELFSAIDRVIDKLDTKRVGLTNKGETRRKARQKEIVDKGVAALNTHLEALTRRLADLLPEGTRVNGPLMPVIESDFWGAVKGKRSFASMESAINDHAAACKVLANQACELRERNLRTLQDKAKDHKHLFADWRELIAKDSELVELQIDQRIQAEKQRIEEEARKKREAEEAAAAQRARDEEAARQRAQQQHPSAVNYQPLTTAQAPSPGPVASTAPAANQPATSTVIPLELSRSGPPTLKVGDVSTRLGFTVTKEFLRKLGHPPAEEVGTRILYHEADFPAICTSITRHVDAVRQQHLREAA